MGAAAPTAGCLADKTCCQCETAEDNEFRLTVAFSTSCDVTGGVAESKPLKVRALPTLGEDNEFEDRHVIEYWGSPALFNEHWNVCDVNECSGDGNCFSPQAVDDNDSIHSEHHARESAVAVKSLAVLSEEPPPDPMQLPSTMPLISDGVPLVEGVESLSPELIQDLMKTGKCVAVDVRGADRASGIIDGARHIPAISMSSPFVTRLPELVEEWSNDRLIVFYCQFCKHRAPYCANLYRQQSDSMQRVAVMEGGFRAWQSKGLPVSDGGGTNSERAMADAWALHQGAILTRQALPSSTVCPMKSRPSPVKSRNLGG